MVLADEMYKSVSYHSASSKLSPPQQSGLTVTFKYDGDGRRVAQTINGVITYYINHFLKTAPSKISFHSSPPWPDGSGGFFRPC